MSQELEIPDWVPEWLTPNISKTPTASGQPASTNLVPGDADEIRTPTPSSQSAAADPGDVYGFSRAPPKQIIVTPSQDRTVKRKLRGIHLSVGLTLIFLLMVEHRWLFYTPILS
jgi:hypothetical protein